MRLLFSICLLLVFAVCARAQDAMTTPTTPEQRALIVGRPTGETSPKPVTVALSPEADKRLKDIQAAIRAKQQEIEQLKLILENAVLNAAIDAGLDRKALDGMELRADEKGAFVFAPKTKGN